MELTAAGTAHEFNVIPLQSFQKEKIYPWPIQK